MAVTEEKHVYFGFDGPIDSQSATRICGNLNQAVNDGFTHIHLSLSSIGGFVSDGIYLHNHIAALPLKVIAYNTGTISSIALPVYLAANERYCSASGTFMMHPASFGQLNDLNVGKLELFRRVALLDEERIHALLGRCTRLTGELLDTRRSTEVWLSADEAVEHGVCVEVREFRIAPGCPVFQL